MFCVRYNRSKTNTCWYAVSAVIISSFSINVVSLNVMSENHNRHTDPSLSSRVRIRVTTGNRPTCNYSIQCEIMQQPTIKFEMIVFDIKLL